MTDCYYEIPVLKSLTSLTNVVQVVMYMYISALTYSVKNLIGTSHWDLAVNFSRIRYANFSAKLLYIPYVQ